MCTPFQVTTEELDSYLYQTVGQDAIEFVARALDVPLYRRVINGSALALGSEYGGRNAEDRGGVNGDETEDLYALLADVKVMQILPTHLFFSHLSVEYTAVPTSRRKRRRGRCYPFKLPACPCRTCVRTLSLAIAFQC
jgi:hypothetical protein